MNTNDVSRVPELLEKVKELNAEIEQLVYVYPGSPLSRLREEVSPTFNPAKAAFCTVPVHSFKGIKQTSTSKNINIYVNQAQGGKWIVSFYISFGKSVFLDPSQFPQEFDDIDAVIEFLTRYFKNSEIV